MSSAWFAFPVRPQPGFRISRWVFLRGLAVVYLIAFASLRVQIEGLVGSQGILPIEGTLDYVRNAYPGNHGEVFPTLCWWNASDSFLKTQCTLGIVLSVVLLLDVAPLFVLAALWILYLSLTTAGQVFLGFQWDALLLETGFLATLASPLKWKPGLSHERAPLGVHLWTLRWLLFRLMFAAGAVKLASRDAVWWNLSALSLHYETQPLPTMFGWYAHQMTMGIQKLCCGAMFFIELLVPFAIFFKSRIRAIAFVVLAAFQVLILLTGNYGYFNLLTIVLSISLLDDSAWLAILPGKLRPGLASQGSHSQDRTDTPVENRSRPALGSASFRRAGATLGAILAFATLLLSGQRFMVQFNSWFEPERPWRGFAATDGRVLAALDSAPVINGYGLFANMTEKRAEIRIEGSDDGETWKSYGFRWKPDDTRRAPCWVQPHMPRLDWQMWFAALYPRPPTWFRSLLWRLLQGSPPVLDLLADNPFPKSPPRYVRAVIEDYHFTDTAARAATGEWWQRGAASIYCPPMSLR